MVMQTSKRAGRKRPCCSDLGRVLSPRLFKALADPTRVGLLIRLATAGSARNVGEMAEGAAIDLSVVSRHLAILREAGVIECVKRGKEVRCSVRTTALARVLREVADLLEACCPAGPPSSEAKEEKPHERP